MGWAQGKKVLSEMSRPPCKDTQGIIAPKPPRDMKSTQMCMHLDTQRTGKLMEVKASLAPGPSVARGNSFFSLSSVNLCLLQHLGLLIEYVL